MLQSLSRFPAAFADSSSARKGALAVALLRSLLGVVALVAPVVPARPWIGREESDAPGVKLFGRALGARDLALGLGAIIAASEDAPIRGWIEAGGLADAGDGVATLLNWKNVPRATRWPMLALIVGSAAIAGVLAPHVDR